MFPRDEIWMRKVYEPEVFNGSLTRIFKPENRLHPNPKGFRLKENIKIRIVETPGNDTTGSMPVVSQNYRKATIENIIVTDIKNLRPKDFKGASRDITDITGLRYNLGLIYDRVPESFNTITIIDIRYS
jgi:hypothetical protein